MGRNRLFTDADFEEACNMYGFDSFKISQCLECTQATVWNHARRMGIDLVSERRRKDAELYIPIVDAFKGHVSQADIAVQFGLSQANTRRLLRGGIEIYWAQNPPPVWPAPKLIQEIKVFHHFNSPPEGCRGWDDDDSTISEACQVQLAHVRSYRTRCHSQPNVTPIAITQQIREESKTTDLFSPNQRQFQERQTQDRLIKGPVKKSSVRQKIEARQARNHIPSRISDESRKASI